MVLILEWSEPARQQLITAFEDAGFVTRLAATSTDALVVAGREAPDLVVTRWDLTAADPVSFVRSIQHLGRVPVVALAADVETPEVVTAFDAGVSALVAWPVDAEQVVARAVGLLRLVGPRLGDQTWVLDGHRELVFDAGAGQIREPGRTVELTTTEVALLSELVVDAGRLVGRAELAGRLWPTGEPEATRRLDPHVSRLRAKLADPDLLHTVWGRGYRLDLH